VETPLTATPKRRRGPWPEPIVVERRRLPAVGEHHHRQPRWPLVSLAVAVLGLTVAVMVLAFYAAAFAEYRERETTRIEGDVGQAVCDVLDRLSAGSRLDPVRVQYGCGPGLPPIPTPTP
jgi:hypothetical protein